MGKGDCSYLLHRTSHCTPYLRIRISTHFTECTEYTAHIVPEYGRSITG